MSNYMRQGGHNASFRKKTKQQVKKLPPQPKFFKSQWQRTQEEYHSSHALQQLLDALVEKGQQNPGFSALLLASIASSLEGHSANSAVTLNI